LLFRVQREVQFVFPAYHWPWQHKSSSFKADQEETTEIPHSRRKSQINTSIYIYMSIYI
jgi:hypothetical protein